MGTSAAMARIHPVAALLRAEDKTQRWLRQRVVEQGGKLSKAHLSQVLSGEKNVSRDTALAISRALGGKVDPAAIMFWRVPSRKKAAA